MTLILAKVFFSLVLIFTKCTKANGRIVYEAEVADDLRSCKDFQNKYITCDSFKFGMISGNDDESSSFGLSGDLEINKSLEEGYSMSIEVWKLMEIGKEFSFATVVNLCSGIKSEEAPWYPLVKAMNLTGCPIPAKVYTISDLIISLDFAKDVLSPEFCGEYEVLFSVLDEKEEQISCHVLGISVTEAEKDD